MKKVNLLSLVQAYNEFSEDLKDKYFDFLRIDPKKTELPDLKSLVKQIKAITNKVSIFDNFFFGYQIPQIGKEFDLLRFGKDYVINIELKSIDTGDKIRKQLVRNKYYLSFLGLDTYQYTYVTKNKRLYFLDEYDNLIITDIKTLAKLLHNQDLKNISDADSLFNPTNYLVSPFNSTEKFIAGEYFLTNQQEQIKKTALLLVNKKATSFISVKGKAGTGKTLLTYDIVKQLKSRGEKVLIIHCGKLNDGHFTLINEHGWDILAIRRLYSENLNNYSIFIVDETQRIYPNQLDDIIKHVKSTKSTCIFSYDEVQCLRQWEINNDIEAQIDLKTSSKKYTLTKKIRTNKEIAAFIISLMNKSNNYKVSSSSVKLNYFDNVTDAKKYMKKLDSEGYKLVNYTPSTRVVLPYQNFEIEGEDSTHDVVGQEFDKVVAVIDSHFYYRGNELSTKGYESYYHPTKMLQQIMTRTRKELNMIVINNNEIMDRCLSILS